MAAQRKKGWASWVAVAAAYLIAVQTLLVGLTLGSAAAPLQTGDAHAVLCLTNPVAQQDGDASSGKTHLPNCCILGCGMFGSALAPPPQFVTFLDLPIVASAAAIPVRDHQVVAISFRTPGNPRAPPLRG
ncbi:hypothetical protein [Microvirga flavescens]|uniref:hypothetical protein n=1 Tax=Microvirga flavescens TaxID=2249811 RepID=UPI000DD75335|nr:hypothetical protein [Microvirga flavescens]